MKIQPIFKKQITELDFTNWERKIQSLMHSNFQVIIQSMQAINIDVADFVVSCKIADKVTFEISANINGEKFYFNPAPQKKDSIIQFEKMEWLTDDLRKLNDKVITLCESIKDGCFKVNQQQVERKKQEEQEKKEAERVKEIFEYSRKRRIERIIYMMESASEDELEKIYMAAKIILKQNSKK